MLNKAPKIMIDGKLYPVQCVDWFADGTLCMVAYWNVYGVVQTAWNHDYHNELADMLVFES